MVLKLLDKNTTYDFRSSLTLLEFLNLGYSAPISIWQEASNKLFGRFELSWCKQLLTYKLDSSLFRAKCFRYNGASQWLDSETRNSILNTITEDTFTLILNDKLIEIKSENLKKFLSDVNIYSYKCKLLYLEYLNQINALEEVKDLDFVFQEPLNLENYI